VSGIAHGQRSEPTLSDLAKRQPVAVSNKCSTNPETLERSLHVALIAATATAEGWSWKTWLILIGLGLIWVGLYAFRCWDKPFTNCPKCEGSGKRRSANGKHWGTCRRCKGVGKRIRTGRKVFNWLKITSEEAK
jgi:hypothetical protein